ncbi:hypothetical protein ANN_05856 [Periplaneta americana]|uniref:Uncharacterized protein n=1 Tax=Periplaneta americana TaxID=6978 RepID=A0ABQ8TDS9_PERAM|nr:hypothetical protein ANN_05856 [Periplaneta americana]
MAGLCEGGNEPPGSLKAKEETILRDMLVELNDSCGESRMKINAKNTRTMVVGRKIKKIKVRILTEAVEQKHGHYDEVKLLKEEDAAQKYMVRMKKKKKKTKECAS